MITSQDMIDRFGSKEMVGVTNEQPRHDSVIDDVVMQAAIGDAVSEVVSYLRPAGLEYQADTAPRVLKLKACDIARYYLYDNGVTPIVEARYEAATKWLDKVKKDPSMLTGQVVKPPSDSAVHVIPNPVPTVWGD